jgi:aspartate/methionine/tyrosine aminotransferase
MPQVSLPPDRTDEEYVKGLLHAAGILCVYGSGFGADPRDGMFRVVFLASVEELSAIYDDIDRFTQQFLRG